MRIIKISSSYYIDNSFFREYMIKIKDHMNDTGCLVFFLTKLNEASSIDKYYLSNEVFEFLKEKNKIENNSYFKKFLTQAISTFTKKKDINYIKTNDEVCEDIEEQYLKLKIFIFEETDRSYVGGRSLDRRDVIELMNIYGNIRIENGNAIKSLINHLEYINKEPVSRIIKNMKNDGKITDQILEDLSDNYDGLTTFMMNINLDNFSSISSGVINKIEKIQKFTKDLVYMSRRKSKPFAEFESLHRSKDFTLDRKNYNEIYNHIKNDVLGSPSQISEVLGVALFLKIFGNIIDNISSKYEK